LKTGVTTVMPIFEGVVTAHYSLLFDEKK